MSTSQAPIDTQAPAVTDDLELVARALDGDEDCAERLFHRLLPVVERQVTRLVRRRAPRAARQDMENLVQDLILQLFVDQRLLATWQPARGLALENFVDFVTHRRALSKLSAIKRMAEEVETPPGIHELRPDTDPDPEHRVVETSRLRHLLDRLRVELTEESWHLFELRFIEEHSIDQIATITGLNTDAVYARISRIRKTARRLRDELGDETAE